MNSPHDDTADGGPDGSAAQKLVEIVERGVAIADPLFPITLRPDTPDIVRVSVALLARCVTTSDTCARMWRFGRRSDLMVTVRSLFEHVVMLAWLLGADSEHRMLMWQRYCDEQAVRFDDELIRLGGAQQLPDQLRERIDTDAAALGAARVPGLADRCAQVDREWTDRLGFDPKHRDAASMRRAYSIIFRVGSAVAHPTLAGLGFVTDRVGSQTTIRLEESGRADEALMPVPTLLATALAVSSHSLGRPGVHQINGYLDHIGELVQ